MRPPRALRALRALRARAGRHTLGPVTRPQTARPFFTSYRYFGFAPGSAVVRARL